jgi:hypothetical protein
VVSFLDILLGSEPVFLKPLLARREPTVPPEVRRAVLEGGCAPMKPGQLERGPKMTCSLQFSVPLAMIKQREAMRRPPRERED